ncbi:hypothetical protein [Pseudomonas sp. FME51]|uniref:hypothetical protein n=1 Tax=Pseudomonas sp. FME51 TaxID=2742609 RepID=UPI00186687C3|nr:hypothetical protein [Pseudomonas sp. FME51]
MTPVIVIEKATAAGVHLAAKDGQVELIAKERPATHILELIRTHKVDVLDELEGMQSLWLERVAHLLQSTPECLLQSTLLEPVDVRELWHTEPRHTAELIYSWGEPEQYQPRKKAADFGE